MYTRSWDQGLTQTLEEYTFAVPDMCEEREMINYHLPISQQKYKKFEMPDLKSMNEFDLSNLAEQQWHRREHGEWQLIKGKPYYIPGPATMFFDFWTTNTGKRPDFRLEALEFMWFFYMIIEPDPHCLGGITIKPRRIGETEKALFILYERTTRYFNYPGGLQSYSDPEAKKAYNRLVRGHNKMPYFFKPKHSGSTGEMLQFHIPNEVITMKRMKGEKDIIVPESYGEFLDSTISYEAAVTGAFDGSQLGTMYMDEIFKIQSFRMSLRAQWENIRRVITLNNEMTVYGKALLTSTVEEKESDVDKSTVEMASQIWDDSNPNERDKNGRTISGLYRIFRDFTKNAIVDEFGMPKVEQAIKHRQNRMETLMEQGNEEAIISLKRKEPASIEDAFVKPTSNCPLHPRMCEIRLNQLKEGLDRWNKPGERVEIIEGDLVWKNGKPNTEVEFVRRKGGRWNFSQMPFRENAISKRGNNYVAQNMPYYRMGADPYDSDVPVLKGSDGAFCVFRKFNILHEDQGKLQFDENGEVVNTWDMKTNQFVCDYKYRHKDPDDFYRDVILTAWFFGIQFYPEVDKPGLLQWAKRSGYKGLIQYEPQELINGLSRKREVRHGSKTTTHLVSNYVDLLSSHIAKFIWAEKLPRLIYQWMYFETAKRTKFDLAVASGWTLIADMEHKKEAPDEKPVWGANSFYLNN